MGGRSGNNNYLYYLQFKYASKSIFLLHHSIKLNSRNCILLSPLENSLFTIKWSYKEPEKNVQENELNINLLNFKLLAEQYDKLILSSITGSILQSYNSIIADFSNN